MYTHNFLLTVQYITVSVLFLEILIIFMRWKNSIHSYLFFACMSSFISNLGYLFELKATSEEAYITALKISYVGRVWIVFAFFLFSAKMCGIKLPKALIGVLTVIHLIIYVPILTLEKNTLYYTKYEFIPDPNFPTFSHGNGIMHTVLMGLNMLLAFSAIFWIILAFIREKKKSSKLRLFMLIMALSVQIASFVLHISGICQISKYYDLSMLGALFGTIFMLIGIFRFDLLGTREIARDFVVDRISEGIIAVDNDGKIQYFNEPATKIFPEFTSFQHGKSTSNTNEAGRDPYDSISKITEAIKNGESLKIGDRIYTPEENELLYEGRSYGKLYALVDDTEHYQYLEDLQEQRDIADRANEAKSKFLASMSHEIRTPINAVLGMDEMILRESKENNTRKYASDIMSAGKTLLSLINDILDLSKVEEGKMEIIPVQYDLSSLINDLVNMIRDRAAKKGLKFDLNADEHCPHVLFGDEIRIRQCVMNLLTNAVKYTEKGSVTLDINFSAKDKDHILLSFTVKDTGIGMKKEDMEYLFSPYKRIEEERNRYIEGTGLGMSITNQLLALMGSSLKVQSEYGEGSVFSFTIEQPVVKWEELGDYSSRFDNLSGDTYEYRELFHAPDARILVVDDTEMNLTVIQNLLKQTRIGIDTAASGKEAVKLASEKRYDLIFIDHMMPDMDGIETLGHIRESGESCEVPAVALTANAVSGAREMYLAAGFTAYLSKPVDGEKLEKMLFEMLPKEKLMSPDEDLSVDGAEDGVLKDIKIKDIPEIDLQSGLKNCGSEDGYLSVLTVFHQTAPAKADEIEDFFNKKDFENYTIKVHALKSSARIIGAAKLSSLAGDLEDAGRNGDLNLIEENTPRLLEMYRKLDEKLTCLDSSKEDLPEIDEASLKEAYQTMLEIAGSMDYSLMDELIKSLGEYNLPDEDKKLLKSIETAFSKLDWKSVETLVVSRETEN